MRPERILIESLLRWLPLTPAIAPIIKQEHRQSQLVKKLQILETVGDIARVAVAPQNDRTVCLYLNVPPE
jgi:hypothetical protein